MEHIIIFTDLDGTLIDHDTYTFAPAAEALRTLRQRSIPVILCTSKTRAEIERIRLRMDLETPFVAENGAAVFVPADPAGLCPRGFIHKGPYWVNELGTPYERICRTWRHAKMEGAFRMKGFSEMTLQEIALHTGLPVDDARLAAQREYSEPFLFEESQERMALLTRFLAKQGLQVTKGGRFYHVIGPNDKGKAVSILRDLYLAANPGTPLRTVGLGDSANDIPMLQKVDVPVVIRKKSGDWEPMKGLADPRYSQRPGPEGWAEEILGLLSRAP